MSHCTPAFVEAINYLYSLPREVKLAIKSMETDMDIVDLLEKFDFYTVEEEEKYWIRKAFTYFPHDF